MPNPNEQHYTGYGWIKVARHRDDPAASWEERYRILENHHIQETQFLIDEIRRLAKECDRLGESSSDSSSQ
jgi:hypothetical protein